MAVRWTKRQCSFPLASISTGTTVTGMSCDLIVFLPNSKICDRPLWHLWYSPACVRTYNLSEVAYEKWFRRLLGWGNFQRPKGWRRMPSSWLHNVFAFNHKRHSAFSGLSWCTVNHFVLMLIREVVPCNLALSSRSPADVAKSAIVSAPRYNRQ